MGKNKSTNKGKVDGKGINSNNHALMRSGDRVGDKVKSTKKFKQFVSNSGVKEETVLRILGLFDEKNQSLKTNEIQENLRKEMRNELGKSLKNLEKELKMYVEKIIEEKNISINLPKEDLNHKDRDVNDFIVSLKKFGNITFHKNYIDIICEIINYAKNEKLNLNNTIMINYRPINVISFYREEYMEILDFLEEENIIEYNDNAAWLVIGKTNSIYYLRKLKKIWETQNK